MLRIFVNITAFGRVKHANFTSQDQAAGLAVKEEKIPEESTVNHLPSWDENHKNIHQTTVLDSEIPASQGNEFYIIESLLFALRGLHPELL